MSVLAEAFSHSDHRSFSLLSRLFSSPVVRGTYKDEKPEVRMNFVGSKNEQKRLTHLVNTLSQSPTGKKLLEKATAEGYTVGFEIMPGTFGCCTCDEKTKHIALNPAYGDAKLTGTLAHEARHAQQYANGLPTEFLQYDVATELKMWRTAEADAEAIAALCGLEIRAETGESSVLRQFGKTSPHIGAAVRDAALDCYTPEDLKNHQNDILTAGFEAWFSNSDMVEAYEKSYLCDRLTDAPFLPRCKRLEFYEKYPMDKSSSGAEILQMFCKTAENDCYFADNLNIFEQKPHLSAITNASRHAADKFFELRLRDTGIKLDKSYADLAANGVSARGCDLPYLSPFSINAGGSSALFSLKKGSAALSGEKSLLSRLFSSPVVRGFYKDEKPEIDFRAVGSKTEKKRLTHLINTIARNSPTGRKVLKTAAEAGYSVGFEAMADSCGCCDGQKRTIVLNPLMNDAKLTTTLAHESRHAQQDTRGINAQFCTYDIATEIRLRRAKEADAQAVALQTALEIRAATKDGKAFSEFKSSYPEIVAELPLFSHEKTLQDVVADRDKNMAFAFCGWFNQDGIVSAYENGYLRAHLKSIDGKDEIEQMHIFADRPFHGHLSSADIVKRVCETDNGTCYFSNDPHVLNRPQMCGILPETKEAADRFFSRRQQLTDQTKDYSYRELPERNPRSFTPKYGYFDMPYDARNAAVTKVLLNNRSR